MNRPQHPNLNDRDWLLEQYIENRRTMSAIADELGVDKTTVSRAMRFHGIKSAGKGRRPQHPQLSDPEWLREQLRTKTLRQIAGEIGASVGAVGYYVGKIAPYPGSKSEAVRAGLAKRFPNGRSGADSSNWRGGRPQKNEGGYVRVYAPNHPRASGGRVFQHILVAEQTLGRAIGRDEVVHHINHVKDDNRPENLAVMTNGEHVAWHFSEPIVMTARIEQLEAFIRKLGHEPPE